MCGYLTHERAEIMRYRLLTRYKEYFVWGTGCGLTILFYYMDTFFLFNFLSETGFLDWFFVYWVMSGFGIQVELLFSVGSWCYTHNHIHMWNCIIVNAQMIQEKHPCNVLLKKHLKTVVSRTILRSIYLFEKLQLYRKYVSFKYIKKSK